MGRRLPVLIFGCLGLILIAGLALGALLFLVSGGQPVRYIQTMLIQFELSGRQDDLDRPIGSDTTPIRFTINLGDTPALIAENLYAASLIREAKLFVDYVRVSGLDVELEAGTYFLNQAQTIPEIAVTLTDSAGSHIPFRILEGWRIEEIANAIDSNHLFGFTGAEFLAAAGAGTALDPTFSAAVGLPAGASMEGFLFPNTYKLPPDISPGELRDTLAQAFLDQTGPQLAADASAQGFSLFEVATLASIIERESVHSAEDAMISSVYRNRLAIGQKLDADPTVQYAIGFLNGVWWPQITQEDYTRVVSDYNTYLQPGLPPGPIANPGISALRAAVYPEQSDFYYFRAKCDGSGFHEFATSYEQHLANECRAAS